MLRHVVDRALCRYRQYSRSWMQDPQLHDCLGQLEGFCAMDFETGEILNVAITSANVFYRFGQGARHAWGRGLAALAVGGRSHAIT